MGAWGWTRTPVERRLCRRKVEVGQQGQYPLSIHMFGMGMNRAFRVSSSLRRRPQEGLQDLCRAGSVGYVVGWGWTLEVYNKGKRRPSNLPQEEGLARPGGTRGSPDLMREILRRSALPSLSKSLLSPGPQTDMPWRQKEKHTSFWSLSRGKQGGSQTADEDTYRCKHAAPRSQTDPSNGPLLITINGFLQVQSQRVWQTETTQRGQLGLSTLLSMVPGCSASTTKAGC